MHVHAQTIKHVADAAAGTTAMTAFWNQGPVLAAWVSVIYFGLRGGAWALAWWRQRKGSCPTCGDH